MTFLPPPANGGTDAGDILLNSSINWQINSNYDLMTVMAHEFGHALGLGDVSTPDKPLSGDVRELRRNQPGAHRRRHGRYRGRRRGPPVRRLQCRRQTQHHVHDRLEHHSGSFGSNAQPRSRRLDITTGGDSEWFYVTVPATTTGTMNVTVQSSNLSSLSPKLMVYNSSLGLVGQGSAANSMGATVSVSTSVAANQGYYIKVLAAPATAPIGGYGLLVNVGSQSQAPIPPPNTVVAQQPDQGGGSLTNGISTAGAASTPASPRAHPRLSRPSAPSADGPRSIPPRRAAPRSSPSRTGQARAPRPRAHVPIVADRHGWQQPEPAGALSTRSSAAKHHAKVKHHERPPSRRRPPEQARQRPDQAQSATARVMSSRPRKKSPAPAPGRPLACPGSSRVIRFT